MASATLIRRPDRRPAVGLAWLLIASGLLGSGCSRPGPAPSSGPLATAKLERDSRDDSLLLFPHGPEHKLSAAAEAILPRPLPDSLASGKTRVAGSSLTSVTAGWPRRTSHSATTEPSLGTPLRMADRLDPGATTVR